MEREGRIINEDFRPASATDAFTWRVRVYYEDTDAGGIVYHANYLRFCERARTEWLRARGFGQSALSRQWHAAFILTDTAVRFRRPAYLDDELTVTVIPRQIRRASLEFEQQVLAPDSGHILVQLTARAGCIDSTTFKPRPIPEPILRELHHDG